MNDEDYQARLTISCSNQELFDALTTTEGLSAWWTATSGDGMTGGVLTFNFGRPDAEAVMRVDSADRGGSVKWTNLACHVEDWVGTTVHFDFQETAGGAVELSFRHGGLTPQVECYGDCKIGWDHFMTSLRAYLETGVGEPNGSAADDRRRQARDRARETADAS